MNRSSVRRLFVVALLGLSVVAGSAIRAVAAGPVWGSLVPFKKIDADPSNAYPITQSSGPWMIMAMTFRGDKASEQARQLVYEFRSKYKLPAYSYEKTFDFSQPVQGRGVDAQGRPVVGKYQSAVIKEVAVLVGDYETVDDENAQKVLTKVKSIDPDCLKTAQAKDAESLDPIKQFQKSITGQDKSKKGPMAHAMIATNPLLPKEFFTSRGVDKFVIEMNKGVEHSLLDCKGKYSVRVATFYGISLIDQRKIREVEKGTKPLQSKLEQAAENAHTLTVELRKKGYEAYEFHDRSQSMVCVGHFDSVGSPRPDGKIEIDPEIHKLMDVFGADANTKVDKLAQGQTLEPKHLANVALDIQPIPVEVPKRSISADYQRTMRQER